MSPTKKKVAKKVAPEVKPVAEEKPPFDGNTETAKTSPTPKANPAPKKEEKKPFKPVTVDEGVTRVEKETPMDRIENEEPRERGEGNWIQATPQEMKQYEDEGRLLGFDPNTNEVLLAEE